MVFHLLLIPIAHALIGKAAVVGAHHAAVAVAAHSSPHVLAHAGMHLANATVNAAIATGSVLAGLSLVGATAISTLKFLNKVEKYRECNHIDQNGRRKIQLSQIESCNECDCGDFRLGRDTTEGGEDNICKCGHSGWKHSKKTDSQIKAELERFAKSVGWDAMKETLEGFLGKHVASKF